MAFIFGQLGLFGFNAAFAYYQSWFISCITIYDTTCTYLYFVLEVIVA